jgi:hypothetical protein
MKMMLQAALGSSRHTINSFLARSAFEMLPQRANRRSSSSSVGREGINSFSPIPVGRCLPGKRRRRREEERKKLPLSFSLSPSPSLSPSLFFFLSLSFREPTISTFAVAATLLDEKKERFHCRNVTAREIAFITNLLLFLQFAGKTIRSVLV